MILGHVPGRGCSSEVWAVVQGYTVLTFSFFLLKKKKKALVILKNQVVAQAWDVYAHTRICVCGCMLAPGTLLTLPL